MSMLVIAGIGSKEAAEHLFDGSRPDGGSCQRAESMLCVGAMFRPWKYPGLMHLYLPAWWLLCKYPVNSELVESALSVPIGGLT